MNKRGQSMVEYGLIAVLVILGVVVMGPYVLRSVNAHFKLWDDSVQDAYKENIVQAPVGDVPNLPLNCTCTNTPEGCGSSQSGSTCGFNQRIYSHTCSIQGCDGAPSISCQDDTKCCTQWFNINCGTIPIGQPQTSTNCNYGYEIQSKQCGSTNPMRCVLASSLGINCPLPACLGIISQGAIACTNEPPGNGVKLTQNNGITYVGNASSSCNASATCQYYCDSTNGYSLNSYGTGCIQVPAFAACCTRNAGDANIALFNSSTPPFLAPGDGAGPLYTSIDQIPGSILFGFPPRGDGNPNDFPQGATVTFTPVYTGSTVTGWQFASDTVSSCRNPGYYISQPVTLPNGASYDTFLWGVDCGKRANYGNLQCEVQWGKGVTQSGLLYCNDLTSHQPSQSYIALN